MPENAQNEKQLEALRQELEAVKQELAHMERRFMERIEKAERRAYKKLPLTELRFEFHLVEHCNLNCKGCNHFSPIAEPAFLSLGFLERDMKKLSELFDAKAEDIRLLGGEPLLHPELIDCMRITRSYWPTARIRLITNGVLLMNMDESFWDACREYGICIAPTKYPIPVDYDAAEARAREKGVAYEYFNDTSEEKSLYRLPVSLTGGNDPRKSFFCCGQANYSVFLRDGKLYPCCLIPTIHHFNKRFHADLEVTESDCIDIYSGASAEEILEFLSNPRPFCKYCDPDHKIYGMKWERSKGEIEEWI